MIIHVETTKGKNYYLNPDHVVGLEFPSDGVCRVYLTTHSTLDIKLSFSAALIEAVEEL